MHICIAVRERSDFNPGRHKGFRMAHLVGQFRVEVHYH
jgi:hypothetical protein